VIGTQRGATTYVVTLSRTPDIGDELKLPDGGTGRVRRVISADDHDVNGVILVDMDE
jgi:hypothetical protein